MTIRTMLAPLSWLKEYVDITLTPKELGDCLTEVGVNTEKITKTYGDVIFDFEITPNRPDLLSIIGIAREIAAIENKKIKFPPLRQGFAGQAKPKKVLPLAIKTDLKINPRFTAIIIDEIKVDESPEWLKNRLAKIGQRPINNIVDITNYVMLELGNPIHAFDYDKISGSLMIVEKTKGGEKFESVDGITYHLPKDAVVIRDKENVIDLCGIKGGKNSGTYPQTKTIIIRVPVEIPSLIRKSSQMLSLRSDASSIFERGVNAGGTLDAIKRCVDLILEIAGGKIASSLYDIKSKDFKPWKLKLRLSRLKQITGITIPEKKVTGILSSLNLSPVISFESEDSQSLNDLSERSASKYPKGFFANAQNDIVECLIPTYRNDLKIEEDLIEEVARLYGYNNFPKTMPLGEIPTKQIPYSKDYKLEEKAKNILKAGGFSELYTYSLISENELTKLGLNPQNVLRVDNPVSREFEYLRPTLKINLLKAFIQNKPNFKNISLFELGKVYLGRNLDETKETYFLSGITNTKSFFEVKGILIRLFEDLGVKVDPTKFIEILNEGIFFELNYSEIIAKVNLSKKFIPIPKYPPIIEDLSLLIKENIKTIDIASEIKNQSSLIVNVSLLDQFEDSRTFHIVYQHKDRNLIDEEVGKIRSKILKSLKEKFKVTIKE